MRNLAFPVVRPCAEKSVDFNPTLAKLRCFIIVISMSLFH